MAYHYDHPLPAARHIDFPSVAGFAMAALGAGTLVVEVNARGWWVFATSGVHLTVVMVWLTLAGLLSGWAFQRGEGWWQALALLGVVVSGIGVALLLILAVIWFVSEHPDILTDDSKKKRKGSGNKRRRRQGPW